MSETLHTIPNQAFFTAEELAVQQQAAELQMLPTAGDPNVAEARDILQAPSELSAVKVDNVTKATEQLGLLESKTDGDGERILDKVAHKAEHDLREFGIRGTKASDINGRLVELSGADITKTQEAKRAEAGVVGSEVIDVLASNKPNVSRQSREEIVALMDHNPGVLRVIASEVTRRRQGATVSKRSAELAGNELLRVA